jgi:DNA polymerase III epsilon subunit-like protein
VDKPLLDDEEFRGTTFHVIDFEATTPRGHRPEPIEVGVISLRVHGTDLTEVARFTELMRPPGHAPITPMDTAQTGIAPHMVAAMPPAGEVLAKLDAWLTSPQPWLMVAHHAPTEAGILYDYRHHCPRLAVIGFVDTVRLSRLVYPDLHSHRLDAIRDHLKIPPLPDRHRALPDTQLTAQLFVRILSEGARIGMWGTLGQIRKAAGCKARAAMPRQEALFD